MRDRARPTRARLSSGWSPAACAAVMARVKRTSAESRIAAGCSSGPLWMTPEQNPSARRTSEYPANAAAVAMSRWRLGTC
jgi:hypothetical protein